MVSAAPASPLVPTRVTPTVTIGGVSALVSFSGLTPGFAGLYQVNAQVPTTALTGSTVPVLVSMGSAISNTVTVAAR